MDKLKPELLDQLRKPMRLKRYSLKTDKSGVRWGCLFFFIRGSLHSGRRKVCHKGLELSPE